MEKGDSQDETVTVKQVPYEITGQVEGRKYLRAHYINTTKYHIVGQEQIHTGLSVDISKGGLGMITDHPLEVGTILVFDEEVGIRINNISVNAFITRWAREAQKNRYRVGLEFVR